MTTANTVARVIAAEATSGTTAERIADMRAIASVIANRAEQLGVSQYDVIANQVQFNAFGTRMPAGTAALVDMAQEQIDYVAANGPTTRATFYATPAAVDGLPDGLDYETETTGHQFYSDPQYRSIDTAVGSIMPNQYAFAQNPQNVPVPGSADDAALTAKVDPGSGLSTNWGLNPDVAPVPVQTFNPWDAMANAQPVQAPVNAAPTKGMFAAPADLAGFKAGMDAQRQTMTAREPVAPINSFADPAAAGPFGGEFAAPEDRFADMEPSQAQPFDRIVQTTSIPTAVDPNSYQPGTAPMVDTSAAPTNRVQSISITPDKGLFAAPQGQPITQADVDRGFFNATGDGAFDPSFAESLKTAPVSPNSVQTTSINPQSTAAPQAINQTDAQRALRDPALGQMEPGLVEAMMSPQNPVVPTAVETASFTPPAQVDNSRFTSVTEAAPKTSRIGQLPGLTDEARIDPLTGAINPATNTQSFMDQPSDIGGFLSASAAQRGPQKGIFSAEAMAQQGRVYNESLKAEAARHAAAMAANPALATPNFAQAVNPTMPSLSVPTVETGFLGQPTVAAPTAVASQRVNPTASPQQQAAGYQQMASAATQADLLNLSGSNLYDVNLSGKVIPTTPYTPTNTLEEEPAPALETVNVPDQPTIAKTQVDIPGPLSTPTDQQAQQSDQITAPASRTTPQSTTSKRGFWDRLISPQTAIGAGVGTVVGGPMGGFLGAALGQQIAQNPGMFSSEPMQINNIGSGYENVTSIWGGGQPPGTQATASDGQTVTAMSGGRTAITNSYGVTTVFDSTGKASSYHGSDLSNDNDNASTSSGGFFGGLFS